MQDDARKTLTMLKIKKVICQGQLGCFLKDLNVFVILCAGVVFPIGGLLLKFDNFPLF